MKCTTCLKETTNPKFCSRSCAATFTNQTPKRHRKNPICKVCNQSLGNNQRTYCSSKCQHLSQYIFLEDRIRQTGCYYTPSSNPGTKTLRRYLIHKHGNNCMLCGHSGEDWHGKPITLIVDHINGHANDWANGNIRLVCPNCDSQLPTYKGRNKGNSTRKYTITQK